MNIKTRIASALLATLLFAACSGGLNGSYEGGMATISFAAGKADISLMGNTIETDFSVDGNKIKLHAPGGGPDVVLTRNADGSLDTPWGTMKKKQ